MKVELISSRADLPGLANSWDELAKKDGRDGFFRTYGWYKAWIDHIRPDAQPFVISVRDDSGKLIGLAPLCRGVYRDLGLRLKSVFWGGREVVSGDFLDFLSETDMRHQVISATLDFLAQNRARWSLLVMGELVDGGESYTALERAGKQHDLGLRRQEERMCPYIELPDRFDDYLGSLGSSTRYHIRRRMRDVEKKGALVEVVTRPDEVAARLDTLIQLHLARWRQANLPGTLARPGFAAFLRQVCSDPPADSQCRLYLLNHGGATVAALMVFHFQQSVLYYQAGWAPESPLAQHSPAVVLMAHSIRDAIAEGRRYYEFLRGDEAYKSRWTKTYRKTATVLLSGGMMAKQYLLLAGIKDNLKHLLGRGQSASADPVESVESPVREV